MTRFVVGMRMLMIALIAIALVATLTDTSGLVPDSFFDIASFYTFQTNIILAIVLVVLTWHSLRGSTPGRWVEYGRAFSAVNLVVVGILYWSMIFPRGTEDGAQMVWVMIISHIATPVYFAVEYMVVGSREALPLRHWWIIAGYAGVWTVATVARTAQGDYIAYDHLDPAQHSYLTIATTVSWHSVILLAATVVALRVRRFRAIDEPAQGTEPVRARQPARVLTRVR
ncbi:MAG: hypothetical protein CVT64_00910 [Actinobacteria bacterium HGW-Actinobacteria-4]|nr:MAG: hypothetical protein CVT64_00910 [Actinobacteria bacterium HGW-Actinobacteria-4]